MRQTKTRLEASLYRAAAQFQTPTVRESVWQLANSILPYLATMVAMYWALGVSYWLTLALALPAAGFLIRVFIIFHDCGHGSFFRSRKANRWVGRATGVFFFLPFHYWTHEHAVHHATAGDLDHRGHGDIHTLTVREYRQLSRFRRFLYQLYRHPFVMLVLGPLFVFLVRHRYWLRSDDGRLRSSALWMNLALIAAVVLASFTIGLRAWLSIQVPVLLLAGAGGVWLFYVQHQFDGAYWEKHENWSHFKGALQGSSFYKLPAVLQWFTGNIGFHHVHHLSPRIPNYRLQACHEAIAELRNVKPITLRESLKTLRLKLWCEERGRMVGFAEAGA